MAKVEAEYDNANYRRDSIGVAENDEATMIGKFVTNIESKVSKAETTETNGVGGGDNSRTNTRSTEMDVIITGVGEYTDHMKAEVAEDDQYAISTTGVSMYTKEEGALDMDGYDDNNIGEGTKSKHE